MGKQKKDQQAVFTTANITAAINTFIADNNITLPSNLTVDELQKHMRDVANGDMEARALYQDDLSKMSSVMTLDVKQKFKQTLDSLVDNAPDTEVSKGNKNSVKGVHTTEDIQNRQLDAALTAEREELAAYAQSVQKVVAQPLQTQDQAQQPQNHQEHQVLTERLDKWQTLTEGEKNTFREILGNVAQNVMKEDQQAVDTLHTVVSRASKASDNPELQEIVRDTVARNMTAPVINATLINTGADQNSRRFAESIRNDVLPLVSLERTVDKRLRDQKSFKQLINQEFQASYFDQKRATVLVDRVLEKNDQQALNTLMLEATRTRDGNVHSIMGTAFTENCSSAQCDAVTAHLKANKENDAARDFETVAKPRIELRERIETFAQLADEYKNANQDHKGAIDQQVSDLFALNSPDMAKAQLEQVVTSPDKVPALEKSFTILNEGREERVTSQKVEQARVVATESFDAAVHRIAKEYDKAIPEHKSTLQQELNIKIDEAFSRVTKEEGKQGDKHIYLGALVRNARFSKETQAIVKDALVERATSKEYDALVHELTFNYSAQKDVQKVAKYLNDEGVGSKIVKREVSEKEAKQTAITLEAYKKQVDSAPEGSVEKTKARNALEAFAKSQKAEPIKHTAPDTMDVKPEDIRSAMQTSANRQLEREMRDRSAIRMSAIQELESNMRDRQLKANNEWRAEQEEQQRLTQPQQAAVDARAQRRGRIAAAAQRKHNVQKEDLSRAQQSAQERAEKQQEISKLDAAAEAMLKADTGPSIRAQNMAAEDSAAEAMRKADTGPSIRELRAAAQERADAENIKNAGPSVRQEKYKQSMDKSEADYTRARQGKSEVMTPSESQNVDIKKRFTILAQQFQYAKDDAQKAAISTTVSELFALNSPEMAKAQLEQVVTSPDKMPALEKSFTLLNEGREERVTNQKMEQERIAVETQPQPTVQQQGPQQGKPATDQAQPVKQRDTTLTDFQDASTKLHGELIQQENKRYETEKASLSEMQTKQQALQKNITELRNALESKEIKDLLAPKAVESKTLTQIERTPAQQQANRLAKIQQIQGTLQQTQQEVENNTKTIEDRTFRNEVTHAIARADTATLQKLSDSTLKLLPESEKRRGFISILTNATQSERIDPKSLEIIQHTLETNLKAIPIDDHSVKQQFTQIAAKFNDTRDSDTKLALSKEAADLFGLANPDVTKRHLERITAATDKTQMLENSFETLNRARETRLEWQQQPTSQQPPTQTQQSTLQQSKTPPRLQSQEGLETEKRAARAQVAQDPILHGTVQPPLTEQSLQQRIVDSKLQSPVQQTNPQQPALKKQFTKIALKFNSAKDDAQKAALSKEAADLFGLANPDVTKRHLERITAATERMPTLEKSFETLNRARETRLEWQQQPTTQQVPQQQSTTLGPKSQTQPPRAQHQAQAQQPPQPMQVQPTPQPTTQQQSQQQPDPTAAALSTGGRVWKGIKYAAKIAGLGALVTAATLVAGPAGACVAIGVIAALHKPIITSIRRDLDSVKSGVDQDVLLRQTQASAVTHIQQQQYSQQRTQPQSQQMPQTMITAQGTIVVPQHRMPQYHNMVQCAQYQAAIANYQQHAQNNSFVPCGDEFDKATGARKITYVDPRLSPEDKKKPENHVMYTYDKQGKLSVNCGKAVTCVLPPHPRENGGFDIVRVVSGKPGYAMEVGAGQSAVPIHANGKPINHDALRATGMVYQHADYNRHVTHGGGQQRGGDSAIISATKQQARTSQVQV